MFEENVGYIKTLNRFVGPLPPRCNSNIFNKYGLCCISYVGFNELCVGKLRKPVVCKLFALFTTNFIIG